MTRRVDYPRLAAEAYQGVLQLERAVRRSQLEPGLIELVKLRASYLNGCAYCVDMHTKDARAAGESEQRLYAVPVWRETPFFTPRERAALAWTEAVTLIGQHGVPDSVREMAAEAFTDQELAQLTMAVVVINCWNRLAVALGADVGSYQPNRAAAAT